MLCNVEASQIPVTIVFASR